MTKIRKYNGVYKLPIKKHKVLIDIEDLECIENTKWRVDKYSGGVVRTDRLEDGSRKTTLLHRTIMGKYFDIKGKDIDHKNHNRLDNRKANLRICSRLENTANRRHQKNNTSGYIGVHLHSDGNGRWVASASYDKNYYYLGSYSQPEEAAAVRDFFVSVVHGSYAYFNFKEFYNE